MRKLNDKQQRQAAQWLALAHGHQHAATALLQQKDAVGALGRLYQAAHCAARAALADSAAKAASPSAWNALFRRRHGSGRSWLTANHAKTLTELEALADSAAYASKALCLRYQSRVEALVTKVLTHTPLRHYDDFIGDFIARRGSRHVQALEFDYYCPKSYIHKERIQCQVRADQYTPSLPKRLSRLWDNSVGSIGAKRREDYVLGWNNRLGQGGEAFLLFLDIDADDQDRIKRALAGRAGWLFTSGHGYHFIGKTVYPSREAWQREFERCHRSRRLKPILDARFLDFSLRRGYSTLRIARSPVKNFRPFLCWESRGI